MAADPHAYRQAKKRLLRGLNRIIREADQLSRDLQWWNEHRTDAPPFDRGGDLAVAFIARKCLKLVEADQPLPDDLWKRLRDQLKENSEQ